MTKNEVRSLHNSVLNEDCRSETPLTLNKAFQIERIVWTRCCIRPLIDPILARACRSRVIIRTCRDTVIKPEPSLMRYPRSGDRKQHNTCAVSLPCLLDQNSLIPPLPKCQMRTPEKARKPNRIRWPADRFCIVYSDAPWARESACSLLIGY